jgi:hypothetical protein
VQILIELALIRRADASPQIGRVGEHGVEDTLVAALNLILEEPVESEGGVKLERVGVVGELQEMCEE